MASINFNIGFTLETQDQGFKYKDLGMSIRKKENNFDLEELTDLNAIKNGFQNIFTWEKGERILNPEFGNPFTEFLYEPVNERTAKNIGAAVKSAILTWEPRVTIESVEVLSDPDANEYRIEVVYKIPSLNINPLTYSMVVGN